MINSLLVVGNYLINVETVEEHRGILVRHQVSCETLFADAF